MSGPKARKYSDSQRLLLATFEVPADHHGSPWTQAARRSVPNTLKKMDAMNVPPISFSMSNLHPSEGSRHGQCSLHRLAAQCKKIIHGFSIKFHRMNIRTSHRIQRP